MNKIVVILNVAVAVALMGFAVRIYRYQMGFGNVFVAIVVCTASLVVGGRYAQVPTAISAIQQVWPGLVAGIGFMVLAAIAVKVGKK